MAKLISLPSKSAVEYKNLLDYVEHYLDKVNDVICGMSDNGIENETDDDIDYQFILDRIKTAAQKDFPNDFNIFPAELTSLKDLNELYDTIAASYTDGSHQPRLVMTCKECGREFFIYNNDIEFYAKNGYDLPKRCKDCRKNRRAAKQAAANEEDS